ncbi:phosphotransferase [Nesterenkonia flava]|uniref:Phosphotransferase n=1 Tax=Nesterenkonia flava TaxID=469799 RepID=A0ABU1FQX4_9MICC|nr:phosphotransferase [Nesterenkonia flava]MDR5711050.1 phosphotransferase [Nesterenkonia flava]
MMTYELPQVAPPPHVPPQEQADAHIVELIGLDGAEALLDSHRLSALLGREVLITHLRIKPRHSLVVAFREAGPRRTGASCSGYGWITITDDADKFTKALQRASKVGETLTVLRDESPWIISGSVWADPVLAKDVADMRSALGGRPVEVLRYNPRRRLVAAVGEGETRKVIRVVPGAGERLLSIQEQWRSAEVPVTRARPLGQRGSATIVPLWGYGDLVHHPHAPAAETAGAALAQLHARTTLPCGAGTEPADSAQPPGGVLPVDPQTPAHAVALYAPWLERRSARLSELLTERLTEVGTGSIVRLHGDLSPDQVILAAEGSHKIRFIDLERSGMGEALRDLGSWVAACRRMDLPHLVDPFLEGYARASGQCVSALRRSAASRSWEAYAHLSASLDSFRHRERDWPQAVTRAIELAEEALSDAREP